MKTYDSNNSLKMPPPPSHGMDAASKTSTYEHRLARIRDDISQALARLEKSRARAHYAVGKIILEDPTLHSEIAPKLEHHLAKLGSARKAVDEYHQTVAELERLRKLLP